MLTEGKVRMSTFRVVGFYQGNHDDEYVEALTAQQAVDFVRRTSPEGVEIVEVAKVVKNWK